MFRSSLFHFSLSIILFFCDVAASSALECRNFDFSRHVTSVLEVGAKSGVFSNSYSIHVIKSDAVNAFALKGGRIIFSTRIIEIFETSDEFYSILFHEIGHHELGHLTKSEGNFNFENIFGGGIGDIVNFYRQGQMSQSHESEADFFAAKALATLRFDPKVLLKVLKKIDPHQPSVADLLFGSHPVGSLRVGSLSSFIDNLNSTKSSQTVQPWPRFIWACEK